jgi:VanZ family protein
MPKSQGNLAASATILRVLPWVVLAAIVYASLYPFELSLTRLSSQLRSDWCARMLVARSSPVDTVANLFFYIPLGFAILLRTGRKANTFRAVLLGVGLCMGLSLALEILQHATATRTPSLLDLCLNTVSGTAGAALAIWSPQFHARLTSTAWLRHGRLRPAEVTIAALWLCLHAAPFIPRMGLYRTIASLDDVRIWEWSLSATALWVCRYLLLATILRLVLQRARFWVAYLLVIAGSLAAQIVFIQHYLSPDEIMGAAIVVPIIGMMREIRSVQTLLPIWSLALLAYTVSALAPFNFSSAPQTFDWLPFTAVMESGVQFGFFSMTGKVFVFLALLWLAMQAKVSLFAATAFLFLATSVLEMIQIYLPDRAAELTDPVLVLLPALLLLLLNRQEKLSATGASVARGNPRDRAHPE